MGRKKIQISRITDERNRQVIMSSDFDRATDVSPLHNYFTLIAINTQYIFYMTNICKQGKPQYRKILNIF